MFRKIRYAFIHITILAKNVHSQIHNSENPLGEDTLSFTQPFGILDTDLNSKG